MAIGSIIVLIYSKEPTVLVILRPLLIIVIIDIEYIAIGLYI